jgi:hypothetical protein
MFALQGEYIHRRDAEGAEKTKILSPQRRKVRKARMRVKTKPIIITAGAAMIMFFT